jgi:invasion protein IalB
MEACLTGRRYSVAALRAALQAPLQARFSCRVCRGDSAGKRDIQPMNRTIRNQFFSMFLSMRFLTLAAILAATLVSASGDASAQMRVDSEHGFWKVICETPPGAKSEQCGIHQSVEDATRTDLGLSITIIRPADRKGDLMRIQAPLGILLPTGVGLEIDGQNFGNVWFIKCFQDGCWADADIDAKLLEALKKGKQAIFKVFQTPEEGIGIPVDLTGFSEAYLKIT